MRATAFASIVVSVGLAAACSGYDGGGDARVVPLVGADAASVGDGAGPTPGADASAPRDAAVDSEPNKSTVVAYYAFDDDARDESKPTNGLDLTVQNASFSAGKVGSALVGTGNGVLASRPQVDAAFAFGSGDFTISAWIFATTIPLSFGTRTVGLPASDGWTFTVTQTNASFATNDPNASLSSSLPSVSDYRQFVLRRKSGVIELIVEASILMTRSSPGSIGPEHPFSIQRTGASGIAPRIDELVVFSRALTDVELAEMRSAGQNGQPVSLDE